MSFSKYSKLFRSKVKQISGRWSYAKSLPFPPPLPKVTYKYRVEPYRDVSWPLQLLRNYLCGRKIIELNRHADEMSCRDQPQPNIPKGVNSKHKRYFYAKRNPRSHMGPPEPVVPDKKKVCKIIKPVRPSDELINLSPACNFATVPHYVRVKHRLFESSYEYRFQSRSLY